MEFEDFCRLLSEYLDEELASDICDEFERHIEENCFCENLFNTFRRTVDLCHEIEELEVPQETHIIIYKSLHIEIWED